MLWCTRPDLLRYNGMAMQVAKVNELKQMGFGTVEVIHNRHTTHRRSSFFC